MAWFFLPQGSDAKVDVLVFSGLSVWHDQFWSFQLGTFWFTEMAILGLKKYFSSIATYLELGSVIFGQQIGFRLFSTL